MADLFLILAGVLTVLTFAMAGYRFFKGPTAADRIVGFDALTIVSVTGIILAALISGRAIYLDVALVYALLSFLGVLVAARYIEGGEE
ncbi:monovalent cation/H+ antiporter complex subunit F [Celeribacter litoreus]|uniref:monovalent cation/H+ antiporter complex subunit F n=1 Tax=Celeribacter litoreus TaxID=2876714 RepID=UPI001CCD8C19|nr:monovalent cation/H+ antiporter complex subunit F [Celeribacter litoreus]MCA0043268.1 pH regulation protein F [Celeribacter litoreus]